jgi:hypothetical protein
MATGRIPTTANSPLTAKGDLFGYSTTQARVAVGNDGETLVADSSTSTGLRWQGSQAAGKNAIINGGMDIWQRGTSFTSTNSGGANYGADRWNIYNARSGTTYSRQTASLDGFQYSMRVQRDSGNTATGDLYLSYMLESADSYRFAGKQATLSFWAKAGANYSAASSALTTQLRTGTGTDQNIWVGYTGSSTIASSAKTLTTSWQRFSITGSVGSTTTEMALLFAFTPVGTAGANDWFEITGVQLELGDVPTSFLRPGGTIQGELAACQRYYYRTPTGAAQASTYMRHGSGAAFETTRAGIQVQLPVPLRVLPSSVDYANLALNRDVSTSHIPVTLVAIESAVNGSLVCNPYCTVASGLTVGTRYELENNGNSAGYIGFSAEL